MEFTAFVAASTGITFGAAATVTADQVLDAQRLTVLGLLLTLGLTVGFGIGGWAGTGAGLAAGLAVPVALVLAFRNRRTRGWLARLADKAIGSG
jgi:hypothetical protein